ncbi:MAG: hypothetical protein DRI34_12080 [Deltaproteobacteria bacterium]|nr:MAG: hypothetical protein DRI34_12080 [Deltaproteobacteria bacterium]
MPPAPEGFQKVGDGDRLLFGPAGILACGFSGAEQQRLERLLDGLGLAGQAARIFAGEDDLQRRLQELFALADGHGRGRESGLPRALIIGGISEGRLQQLMAGYRRLDLPRPLWAALTPTSQEWTLEQLLAALAEEDAAFGRDAGGNDGRQ